jgi:LacI family transcriptional regulator
MAAGTWAGTPGDDERFRGFRRALLRAGLAAPEAPRLRGELGRGRGRETGEALGALRAGCEWNGLATK